MRVILYLISCSFLFISCEWSSEEPFQSRQIKSDRPFFLNYIFVDRSDRIWCAGWSGYALYENENWFFDEETFREISVFNIAQAPDGAIWLGTGDGVYMMVR